MSFPFWTRLLKLGLGVSVAKSARHATPRPARAPFSIERLEDRTVPSAGFNSLGATNNPTVNAAPASTGLVVVGSPGQTIGNNPFPSVGGAPGGQNGALGLLVGAAAVNSLGLDDASVGLFASSAVNSHGIFNQLVATFVPNVYGFGSGTQPGQPWVPNAYNLGLANHQSSFPSMSDLGFQPTAAWPRNLIPKPIDESVPAQDDQLALSADLTRIKDQENGEGVPLRAYREVSPEQVLDEVEDEGNRRDAGRENEDAVEKTWKGSADEPMSATLLINLSPPTLGSNRLQTVEPLRDLADPTFYQENRSEGRTEVALTDYQSELGLINTAGEKDGANLEVVSLTEFPTLSRMLLLPSLSTLLMVFPLPPVRIDSTADRLESALAGIRLATNPDSPTSGD